ncbi:hypothetical protein [Nocardia neocaledoniensis]|nr:hypothetical protein [Nocardia neocaledoniensis]
MPQVFRDLVARQAGPVGDLDGGERAAVERGKGARLAFIHHDHPPRRAYH